MKKRNTWLWVLGWIFFFPIPVTILLVRNKSMDKKLRFGLIAAAWVVYSILAVIGGASKAPDANTVADRSAEAQSEAATTVIASESTSKTNTPKKNTVRVYSFGPVEVDLTVPCSASLSYNPPDDAIITVETDNPDIATVTDLSISNSSIRFAITGVSEGDTKLVFSSSDGTVNGEQSFHVDPKDTSRVVYITPEGEKYHFSKKCAGDSAIETTLNKAKKRGYGPCGKCAD